MNRRIRRRSAIADGYLRYLKPGALAKLRDSKINAIAHHRSSSDSQIYLHRTISSSSNAIAIATAAAASPSRSPAASSPSRSPNAAGHQEVAGAIAAATDYGGGSPCFSMRFYGPRCPQRKKLMAARSMFFLTPNPNPSLPPAPVDGPEPVIDAFTNDFLVAH